MAAPSRFEQPLADNAEYLIAHRIGLATRIDQRHALRLALGDLQVLCADALEERPVLRFEAVLIQLPATAIAL